jgi:hypothetical protein
MLLKMRHLNIRLTTCEIHDAVSLVACVSVLMENDSLQLKKTFKDAAIRFSSSRYLLLHAFLDCVHFARNLKPINIILIKKVGA